MLKRVFVSGAGLWLMFAIASAASWAGGAAFAEDLSEPAIKGSSPAAPEPWSDFEALRLVMDLDASGSHQPVTSPPHAMTAAELAFVFDTAERVDPVEAYRARRTKPGTGLSFNVDTDDEGLTLLWRIGFQ